MEMWSTTLQCSFWWYLVNTHIFKTSCHRANSPQRIQRVYTNLTSFREISNMPMTVHTLVHTHQCFLIPNSLWHTPYTGVSPAWWGTSDCRPPPYRNWGPCSTPACSSQWESEPHSLLLEWSGSPWCAQWRTHSLKNGRNYTLTRNYLLQECLIKYVYLHLLLNCSGTSFRSCTVQITPNVRANFMLLKKLIVG